MTQMLLYWDQVSSIVPYDFIYEPELLGPYMLSLVREGLVYQVIPSMHIPNISGFVQTFGDYVDDLGTEVDRRKRSFAAGSAFRIHIEKLGGIGDILLRQRLAAAEEYPWYYVERETADDFMSYLATSLGQVDSIDSSPVTDRKGYLRRFARAGVSEEAMTKQLDSLRLQVLDQILPVPNHSVGLSELRAFKERHQRELGDFRRRVERELVAAASVPDPSLRQRHLEIFFDEAQVQVAQIQQTMQSAGWAVVKTGVSVLAAVPGASGFFGLAGALWDAVTRGKERQMSQDFAYAAHVQRELWGTGTSA